MQRCSYIACQWSSSFSMYHSRCVSYRGELCHSLLMASLVLHLRPDRTKALMFTDYIYHTLILTYIKIWDYLHHWSFSVPESYELPPGCLHFPSTIPVALKILICNPKGQLNTGIIYFTGPGISNLVFFL